MKKQLVSAMLVLSMAISLIGCGKKDAEEDVAEISTIEPEEEVEAVDDSVAFWDQTSAGIAIRKRSNQCLLETGLLFKEISTVSEPYNVKIGFCTQLRYRADFILQP